VCDEPLPPPPPELHPPDKTTASESHGERTSSLQKQLSQNISSVQRHHDTTAQRHLESSSDRSPKNGSPVHSESASQRPIENSASSLQRTSGSVTQQCPENTLLSQSPSEAIMPQISVTCNAPSMRHVDDTKDNSSTVQQKYHKNSSPDSTHTLQRQIENGISSQRYLERGFSLPRHIEDYVTPPKCLDSNITSQRHQQHSNVTQRHIECSSIQKHVINSNPAQGSVSNEITLQRYHQNGSSQRHLENGTSSQKQGENGSTASRLMDSVNLMQRSIDTPVSMSRHMSNATLTRRPECGTVSNSHLGNSSSHQGYIVTSPAYRNMNDTFARTSAIKPLESDTCTSAGIPLSRHADSSRASLRYPTQKLMVNGKLATPLSEQAKQREAPPDLVRIADRTGLRNGEFILPSKTCLQNFSTAGSNGEGNVLEEPPRISRSPPHVKQENDLIGRQQQMEDGAHEPKISPSPPTAVSTEGITIDSQHLAKTEQNNQEPPAPVTRLAMHSQL